MTADGIAVGKAVALLQSTRKTVGNNLTSGYRLQTDLAEDATAPNAEAKHGLVALRNF